MTRRYFVAELPPAGGLIALSDAEAQHASRVMRAQVGQSVTLFDGCGNQSEATIVEIDRRGCLCDAGPPQRVDREPPRELVMAVALPKPERAKEMVERLTELGVKKLIPLVAQRTQRPPSANQLEKLRRAVVEACKQSERNVLMEIGDPRPLHSCLSLARDSPSNRSGNGILRWVLHPGGVSLAQAVDEGRRGAGGTVHVLIGPEGGWTQEEVDAAREAGFSPVCLGPRIYRVETAAAAAAAVVGTFLGPE